MTLIIPAILEETKQNLENKISQIIELNGVERIQVDFADGVFVPSKTLPIDEFPHLNVNFIWEAHLMVKAPFSFLDYTTAGFKTIVIHYEAFENEQAIYEVIEEIKSLGLTPVLAINPETAISKLTSFSSIVEQYLILSVHPGFQGAIYLPESPARVAELRKQQPNAIIEVDGGIKENNALLLASSGADYLVVGSALYETENLQENFSKLKQIVNPGT